MSALGASVSRVCPGRQSRQPVAGIASNGLGDPLSTRPLDGVVVSGGHDVEPALYKEAAEIEGRYDPDRDVFESGVIDRALDDDTPLLGICRGAQLLNVRLGGTLFQDLQTRRVETSNRRTLLPLIPLKTLCVENDTLLAIFSAPTKRGPTAFTDRAFDGWGTGCAWRAGISTGSSRRWSWPSDVSSSASNGIPSS